MVGKSGHCYTSYRKILLSTDMNFWRRSARTFRLLKERNEEFKEKMGVTQRVLERLENSTLKWYGYVVLLEYQQMA
jgi:hypothetical protein